MQEIVEREGRDSDAAARVYEDSGNDGGLGGSGAVLCDGSAQGMVEKPNVIVIIADQRRYGLSKATGYPVDTSPTLDRLQGKGIGFQQLLHGAAVCAKSYFNADGTLARGTSRPDESECEGRTFSQDLYQVASERGYRTALVGKNRVPA